MWTLFFIGHDKAYKLFIKYKWAQLPFRAMPQGLTINSLFFPLIINRSLKLPACVFCFIIIFTNSLDPDQIQQFLTLICGSDGFHDRVLKDFFLKKVYFEKNQQTTKIKKNFPACKEFKIILVDTYKKRKNKGQSIPLPLNNLFNMHIFSNERKLFYKILTVMY